MEGTCKEKCALELRSQALVRALVFVLGVSVVFLSSHVFVVRIHFVNAFIVTFSLRKKQSFAHLPQPHQTPHTTPLEIEFEGVYVFALAFFHKIRQVRMEDSCAINRT